MKPNLATDGIALVALAYFSNTILPEIGGIHLPGYLSALTAGAGVFSFAAYFYFAYENKMQKFFKSIKFWNAHEEIPELLSRKKNEYGYECVFSLPSGMKLTHFQNIKESVEQFLNAKVKFEYKDYQIIMKVNEVKLQDIYPFELVKCDPMEIVIGWTNEGLKKLKLKCHLLICGASGFGKSTFERGMIVNLIRNNKRSELVLNLVDFKRNELGIFKRSKYVNTFTIDTDGFVKLLSRLEKEAVRRYDIFEKESILDIWKYNETHDLKMPFIVTIVDEIAQCEGDKGLMSALQKRISYDRACGLIYIITGQRISVDILSGSVKANIDNRICFKTVDSTNSWIVLDDKEAAQYLTVPGRGLIKTAGEEMTEFQAMYLSEVEAINLVKHTFKTKEDSYVNRERQSNNSVSKNKAV